MARIETRSRRNRRSAFIRGRRVRSTDSCSFRDRGISVKPPMGASRDSGKEQHKSDSGNISHRYSESNICMRLPRPREFGSGNTVLTV